MLFHSLDSGAGCGTLLRARLNQASRVEAVDDVMAWKQGLHAYLAACSGISLQGSLSAEMRSWEFAVDQVSLGILQWSVHREKTFRRPRLDGEN